MLERSFRGAIRSALAAFVVLCAAAPAFAVCGNGTVEAGEACDDGNLNNGDCCSSTCQFESSASVCRAAAGPCDVSEICTGDSGTCPANTFSFGALCRAATGICDVSEACTGTSASCPADNFASSSTTCRPATGICDTTETCTGSTATCPVNGFASSTAICRASAGGCDPAERCTGSTATCPANTLSDSTTVCRAASGSCDVAEVCSGVTAACPANTFAPSFVECRIAAGPCDVPELCTGDAPTCPGNSFAGSNVLCRGATGICDAGESCTGTTAACPSNAFVGSTFVCRASTGGCDPAESCTGSTATCPANSVSDSTTVCRASTGSCDVAETCNGISAACPANAFASSSTVCRAAAGSCDVSEICTGASATCPANSFAPSFVVCRSAAGICDASETCTGTAAACPLDVVLPSTIVCRAASGVCDPAETCTGSTATCPANAFAASTAVCRLSSGVCDPAETCTGSTSTCPANVFASSTAICRSASAECDTAETCTGASAVCPADASAPTTKPCATPGDPCSAGQCNGAGACTPFDSDADGDADACDNCPAHFNADQLNSDCSDPSYPLTECGTAPPGVSGCCDGGDLCDACPAQPDNGNCDPGEAASATIGSGGGTIATADGAVSLDVPPGALDADTSVSVTENGPASSFALYSGSVLSVSARPEDQQFDLPVTIAMRWNDRDADQRVDIGTCVGGADAGATCDDNADCAALECTSAFALPEQDLVLKRNGVAFSAGGFSSAPFDCASHASGACESAQANCSDAPGTGMATVARCCNTATNEWAFETCNFSEFAAGLAAGGFIPGGGSAATDCAAEWLVDNPLNPSPTDKKGFPNVAQTCTDGDATCDGDGAVNGACRFQVAVCLNVADARLVDRQGAAACTPSAIAAWTVLRPHPDSLRWPAGPNGTALRSAVAAVATAAVSGKHGETLTFTPAVSATRLCTGFAPLDVVLRSSAARTLPGKATVKMRSTQTDGTTDTDTLKLTCVPPP